MCECDIDASIFDDASQYQRASNDINLYSHLVGHLVRVAWPSRSGVAVEPSSIPSLLEEKGLYWPCFCAHSCDHEPFKVEFTQGAGRSVIAQCETRTCGFELNLSEKFTTSTLHSEYSELICQTETNQAVVDSAISNFLFAPSHTVMNNPDVDIDLRNFGIASYAGRYFANYFGESWYGFTVRPDPDDCTEEILQSILDRQQLENENPPSVARTVVRKRPELL